MLNQKSFDTALRVFSRAHTSMAGCLKLAIEAFRNEEIRSLGAGQNHEGLHIHVAATDAGPDTAVVITGFNDISEIQYFLSEKLGVSGK